MDIQFAETTVPVTLGGKMHALVFNANTMAAYEKATGKFFLETLAKLYDALKPTLIKLRETKADLQADPKKADSLTAGNAFQILSKISITDLRALLWAALHEYDKNDVPVWPLTVYQVGRYLTPASIPKIFHAFLEGQAANSPSESELGEPEPPAPAESAEFVLPTSMPRIVVESGGAPGIGLSEDVFASPAETPAG